MGVRSEKKLQLRNKIIEASKTIFSRQDFDETTMEQIATEAGVGLGTAYNYFKSKEELYVLSMAEEMAASEMTLDMTDAVDIDVSELVSSALIKQLRKMNYINKKIWKTALPFMLNGLKTNSRVGQELFKADFRFMDNLKLILEDLINKQLLPDDFNVDTAVDMIFGHILYVLMSYVYLEDIPFEEACDKIRAGVRLIIE
jgi:AcrR family transcriptional regulator